MKIGKLAQMMGRNTDTMINWSNREEFKRFFSADALGQNGQRDFNDADVLLINTIRALQAEGLSWADIEEKLTNGERVHDFPPSAAGVDGITPVQIYAQGLVSAAELENARQLIADLQGQINDLLNSRDAVINAARKEKEDEIKAVRKEKEDEIKAMHKEQFQTAIELGKLQAQVEFLQEQLRKAQGE
jgi:DNA-binding transcriptional MerR regulator